MAPSPPLPAASVAFGGAVLAGGASSRMGRDKAFIEIDGLTLLQRVVVGLAEGGADPVVVIGGDRERIELLGLGVVADLYPGEGPLGGLITALRALGSAIVVVLSCDLVQPAPLAVRTIVGSLGSADVAVPVTEGVEQWMHAAWRHSALPRLEAAFVSGERSVRRAAETLRTTRILDGDPCWYADADRPEDLPSPPR